jgi:pSer/pThr/pTyr-binding forkhead associated (FHA) protein
MSDRTCPSCGATASERLKFCRECGVRLEEAPSGGAGPAADRTVLGAAAALAGASVESTIVAGAPPAPRESAPSDTGDETMIGAAAAAVAGGVDRTVFSGGAPRPSSPEPPAAAPGDRTVIGALPPSPAAAPAAADDAEERETGYRTKTFVGTAAEFAAPPAPPPAPAPAAPPVEEEEPEPISVDIEPGEDDEAPGGTVAAPLPLPPAPAPRSAPPPGPAPSSRPPGPAAPPRKGLAELEHWSSTRKHSRVALEKPEVWVGRDRGELPYPDDSYLSRRHGRFYVEEDGRLFVEDAGTLNGTFLRIRARVRLEHRDVLVVGRHVLRFELLEFDEEDQRTMEGDPLTRVMGVQGTPPRARLVKRQEEGFRGMPFYFGTKRYVLGRTEGTHRFTTDDRMSRRHTQIEFAEGGFWIEDLGSQNGTFLRLSGPRALDRGDVVRMGDQHFKVL